jgi:hypothetical protein
MAANIERTLSGTNMLQPAPLAACCGWREGNPGPASSGSRVLAMKSDRRLHRGQRRARHSLSDPIPPFSRIGTTSLSWDSKAMSTGITSAARMPTNSGDGIGNHPSTTDRSSEAPFSHALYRFAPLHRDIAQSVT